MGVPVEGVAVLLMYSISERNTGIVYHDMFYLRTATLQKDEKKYRTVNELRLQLSDGDVHMNGHNYFLKELIRNKT